LKKQAKAAEAEAKAVGASKQPGLKRQHQNPHEENITKAKTTVPSTISASSRALPIPTSNRGHQMLLKMGWSGGGLGASGTGLQNPIMVSTVYAGRLGLGGVLEFPDLPPENQAFLLECKVCGGPVPKQIWEEHCAGRKHQRKLAEKNAHAKPVTEDQQQSPIRPKKRAVVVSGGFDPKEVLVQAAQRFCEACKRAVPTKAWSMHCGGKKHIAKLARLKS
jgi:hypothetical protein